MLENGKMKRRRLETKIMENSKSENKIGEEG